MRSEAKGVPFSERVTRLRGALELVTGTYPAFLFGGPVGEALPVFHFHEVSAATLEPLLDHLATNGYRTVTTDAITACARHRVHPGPRTVALTFDDAWASLWTVGAPLLARFGFRATTFAIPSRVGEAEGLRRTIDASGEGQGTPDRSATPFATWQELQQLHDSGLIDVQSHTFTHAAVFSGDEIAGFVTPEYERRPLLSRPLGDGSGPDTVLRPDELGAPLYPVRSRMSDAFRFFPHPDVKRRCVAHVAAHGGPAFFDRPDWEKQLRAVAAAAGPGRFETDDERRRAIADELSRGREELNARLAASTVCHVALPWGIAGTVARHEAERTGHDTAFAERLFHRKMVRPGDDPFWLMRLPAKFIPCLPGRGRRTFFSTVQDARIPR